MTTNTEKIAQLKAAIAALELHDLVLRMSVEVEDLIGRALTMHSGINTGLIVTTVWDERDGKFGLTGDTVNTGARLVAHAKEGEILVSPQTQALIAPYFRTESLEPVMMKGKAEPVVPYRILGKTKIQTRLEAAAQRGFTPFVGREKELATLQACLKKTIQGEGQLVTVRGTAGLGKSRLLYEFRNQLDRQKVTVLQGRCQSYGASTPYLPFQDALRRGLHLSDEAGPETLHEKAIRNLLQIDRALEKHIPVFLHLLSIPSREYPLPKEWSGEQLKAGIQEALVAVNTLNTRHKPLVLMLEDWHWADEGSDSALLKLLDVLASYPLMVVLLYRPEYTPKWNEYAYHHTIDLAAVPQKGIVQMIEAVYGTGRIPEDLVAQIVNHSEGNPFFVEELCSLLKEDGTILIEQGTVHLQKTIEQITFPQTVQAVIRAKLDRLEPRHREVMRLASVIGREFLRRILEHIATRKEEIPSSLQHLQNVDFIQQLENLPELTYQFNHVITQEVAYQTLLIKQRTTLHRLVAETIEVLYAERLEEQYEMLAYHYSKSEQWEKGLFYLELAGDKAARNFSQRDARAYYRNALNIIDEQLKTEKQRESNLKSRRIATSLKWAQVSHYAGSEEATYILKTSLGYAKELENKSNIAHLSYWLAQRNLMLGSFEQAANYFSQSIELSEQSNDKALLALSYAAIGRIYMVEPDYFKAEDFLKKSVPLLEELGEENNLAYVTAYICTIYTFLGDFERAIAYGQKAIKIAERTGNLSRLGLAHLWLGACYKVQGNWEGGIEVLKEAAEILRPIDDKIILSGAVLWGGHCLFMHGRREEGLLQMGDAIKLMEAGNMFLNLPIAYASATYCHARAGQWVEATHAAHKCLEWSQKGWKGYECFAYYALALAAEQEEQPDHEKADQLMAKGLDLCRNRGQIPFLALGCFDYARILLERGERQQGQTYLNQAIELFSELSMTWWLEQAQDLAK